MSHDLSASSSKKVYGIDLGTTNSAIAYINDDGKPEIIPNSDCDRITPSVVFFDAPSEEGSVGNIIVGKIAKALAKSEPERVISFIKQEMGTGWTKEIDGIMLTPEKVSAYILKRLVLDAKESAGHDVQDVIITYPAYFGAAERYAMITAAKIAGLNVLQFLNEPTAAALHYGLDKLEGEHTAIVYDLGGATFDVTVLAIQDGEVRCACADGDHRLGGRNWDERLVEYFAYKFAEATGINQATILGDADALYDLQLQAEIAKHALSVRTSTKVRVAFEGYTERIEITREIFDEMTKDLLDRTANLTQETINQATTEGVSKIDYFLLVGGSTRMPQVLAMVKEKFASMVDNEPLAFEVDEAVAKGAAMFGLVKTIQTKVEDRTHESLDNQETEDGKPISEEDKEKAEQQAIIDIADDLSLPPLSASSNKKVYGIDLGTTYSAIAYINDDSKPEIIPNSDCARITPSVVFFEEPLEEGKVGNFIVGNIAKESAKTDPERVISFIKQEMGTGWTREIDGITLTPEKVSACILKRLADDAKKCEDHDVQNVIITCPAYFGEMERQATIAAAKIAELNVLRLLDEPVAAALHYGLDKQEGEHAAIVYDLGGATFDVTVLAIQDGDVRVVCADGDHRLGGRNWDECLVEYFASKFAEATGIDKDTMLEDADALFDLQLQAEIAKQTLTLRTSAKVKVTFDGNSERIEITREMFDEMTKYLLDRTAALTEKMFALAAMKGVTKINDFLLVGGSTRMPQVLAMVKEKFASMVDNEPMAFEVDEAVAKGAALFGLTLTELSKRIYVTPGVFIEPKMTAKRSYGIRLTSDTTSIAENMIIKNDVLPVERERDFPMPAGIANYNYMYFHVFANDETAKVALLENIEEIGEVAIRLPQEGSEASKVRIKLRLSEEGVLSLDVSYLTITPGKPSHVEFSTISELEGNDSKRIRREMDDLVIE